MGHRLSKIYTRTGDKGETGLADGSRISKDHIRVEAIGAVDELNSIIGMILGNNIANEISVCLNKIQHHPIQNLPNYTEAMFVFVGKSKDISFSQTHHT